MKRSAKAKIKSAAVSKKASSILHRKPGIKHLTQLIKKENKSELAGLLEKFTELYDFSPTGYFTLNREGIICELNLSAALLIGKERSTLPGKSFSTFVAEESALVFDSFFGKLFGINVKTSCDIILNNDFKPDTHVQIDGIVAGGGEKCLLVVVDVTARRIAEIELRNHDKIFNLSSDLHCIAGFDGYFKVLNPSWPQVLGWSIEELLSTPIIQFIHPGDQEDDLKVRATLFSSEGTWRFENRFLCKDGSFRRFEWNSFSNTSEKTIISIARDITEKKKIEEEIRNERNLLRTLIDHLPDAIYVKDTQGRKTITNPPDFRVMDNYPATGYLGKTDLEIYPEEMGISRYNDDMEVIRTGVPVVEKEETFIDSKGKQHYYLTSKIPLKNEKEEITGLVGIGRDITQHKTNENLLKESNTRFEYVSKATFDAIWDWNLITANLYWGENFQLLFGHNADNGELNNFVWNKNVHPDDFEKVMQGLDAVIHGPHDNWAEEYRFWKADGQYAFVQDRGIVIRDKNGMGIRMIGAMQDITLQKQTQQILFEAEKRYRALVENSTDGYAILTREGKPVYLSPSIEKILGYTEEEAMDTDLLSLTHPDDQAEVMQVMEKAMQFPGLAVPGGSVRLMHKDGSWHWMEATITNMLHVPYINGIVDNFRDVTKKIEIEKNISNEKELSDSIINNLPGIFYLYDVNGKFIRWNKNFEIISGYGSEEIMQMQPNDFYAPGEQSATREKIDVLLREKTSGIEINLYTKAKKEIPYQINSTIAYYEDEPCLMVMGIDISERKKAEEENVKLAMIANLTINAVVLTDASGHIQWVNRGFERLTGYTPDEVSGKNCFNILHGPETDAEKVLFIRNCIENKLPCKIEIIKYNKRVEKYWADSEIVPVVNEHGTFTGFMVIERDITDRKNAEMELLRLNQSLNKRAAELIVSNEELERFAYVASHDLQEPLRMVSSFMQLLKKHYEPALDEKAQQYIRFAVDGAERMKQLIMDLLEYSKVGTNKDRFEETDMNSILQVVAINFNKADDPNDPVISYLYYRLYMPTGCKWCNYFKTL